MSIFAGCTHLQCPCQEEDGRGTLGLADNAYSSLTFEERSALTDELYGSGGTYIEETPQFIQNKLDELDRELGLLHEERKKYYTRAIVIEQRLLQLGGEKYIRSENFRLQFLRADLFDARSAAGRLCEYFQHKFELFGEEKLARRIQHADLNDYEKEALVSGILTYTGVSDSAGRPLVIFRRPTMFLFSVTCVKRIFFYVLQKVVENNETAQKKGIVGIAYHMKNMPFLMNPSVVRAYHPIGRMAKYGLPVRDIAFHIYYQDLKEHFMLNLMLVLVPRKQRARILTHFKHTHEECIVDAIVYGIELVELPLTDQGDFKYEQVRSYWESQRQLEESH